MTRRARFAFENPQSGNPRGLTVKQHVFPAASIVRFTNTNGSVMLFEPGRYPRRLASPNDLVFCARRAWDQRAETGYMRSIEEDFQRLADGIIEGMVVDLGKTEQRIASVFYSLWYMRARYRYLEEQEIQAKGLTGSQLTKDQEERLEANGYTFIREGGRFPARMMNGIQLQTRVYRYADDLNAVVQWGIIAAQEGEFLVPDVPTAQVIPLMPTLALISPSPNGIITVENLAQINRVVWRGCEEYAFARDFSRVPIGPS